MSAQGLAPKKPHAWYANYKPLPGVPDEFIGRDGQPRAAWRNFLDLIGSDDSERSLAAADRRIHDIGVSYRVHGEASERACDLPHDHPCRRERSGEHLSHAGQPHRRPELERGVSLGSFRLSPLPCGLTGGSVGASR